MEACLAHPSGDEAFTTVAGDGRSPMAPHYRRHAAGAATPYVRRGAPLLGHAVAAAFLVSLVALAAGLLMTRHCSRHLSEVRAHIGRREQALHRLFLAFDQMTLASIEHAPTIDTHLRRVDDALVDFDVAAAQADDIPTARQRVGAVEEGLRAELARDREAAVALAHRQVPPLLATLSRQERARASADAQRLAMIDQAQHTRTFVETGVYIGGVAWLSLLALFAWRRERGRQAEMAARVSRLEESTRELRAFTGRVAHDLRGPLTPILLSSQLIERAPVSDTVRQLASRIEGSAGRLRNMIDLLLSFARLEAPRDAHVCTDLGRATRAVLDDNRERAAAARATFEVVVARDVRVVCEPEIVDSALHNLIDNALKYGLDGERNHIVVRVRCVGDRGVIEVEDHGPGIAPELVPYVFEPLFRGTRGGEGIGLGLATVKRLVEARAGRITVARGRLAGALFVVDLPLAG
jgi:signal transduction histidine kinase